MNAPLVILAILAAVGGALAFFLPQFLHPVTSGLAHGAGEAAGHAAEAAHGAAAAAGAAAEGGHGAAPHFDFVETIRAWQTWVSLGAGALGMFLAWRVIGPEKFARGWSPAQERALGMHQELYEGGLHAAFVRGGTRFSQLLYTAVDRAIIDNLVNGAGKFVEYLADSLRTLQTGYVRNYALVMLAGAVFVVACFMLILQNTPK